MLKNRRFSEFFLCTANITFHTANTIAGTPNNIHICIPLPYLSAACHQQLFTSETNLQICLKNYFFNNTKNKATINKTTNMINPENIISLLFSTIFRYSIAKIKTTLTISDEISTNHNIFQYLISFIRYSHLFYHKTNLKYYCYKIFTQKNSIHVISNCNLSYQRFLLIKICFYS